MLPSCAGRRPGAARSPVRCSPGRPCRSSRRPYLGSAPLRARARPARRRGWLTALRMPPPPEEAVRAGESRAPDRGDRPSADLHRGRHRPDDGPGRDEPPDDRHAVGHDGSPPLVRGHGLRHPVAARGGHVPARLLHRHPRPALGRAHRHRARDRPQPPRRRGGHSRRGRCPTPTGSAHDPQRDRLELHVRGGLDAGDRSAYAPAERARTQAANDFLVFGTAAVTSLSSGQLLHHRGWQVVLATAAVMLLRRWPDPSAASTRRGTDRAARVSRRRVGRGGRSPSHALAV